MSKLQTAAVGAFQRGKKALFGGNGGIEQGLAAGLLGRAFWWGFMLSGVTYALFQKKLLPKPISKWVSVAFFYPTYPVTYLLRWKKWKTVVDDTLILGVAPMNALGHPEHLYKLGVRGVVNMCHEYEGPQDAYSKLGITQLRLPSVDHFEPSLEYMEEAVKFIKQHKDRGEKVYVHCKAGHGRAAAIALCWMLYDDPKVSAKDANAVLCSKRKVRPTLFKQRNVGLFKNRLDAGSIDGTDKKR